MAWNHAGGINLLSAETTFAQMGDVHPVGIEQIEFMPNKDPLKSYYPQCGELFGHSWQLFGLKQHLWEAHGISGQTEFNRKAIKFPKENSSSCI